MNNEKKITWKHLEKYLTCPPYFVWNDFKSNEIITEEKYEDENEYWSLEFDDEDVNYVEYNKTGFDVINDNFREWIENKYKARGLNILIIKEKKSEIGIIKTKEAMNDPNVHAILYPIFEYNGAISKPTLFDKDSLKISNMNVSTGTKRNNYIKAFFDYNIVLKQGYKVKNFSIYTIEIKTFKKNDKITFEETFFANTSINKPSKRNDSLSSLKEAAFGNYKKNGGTIFYKISTRNLSKELYFSDIDNYISLINKARNEKRKNIKGPYASKWGSSKFLRQILQERYPYLLPISGNLMNNKKILSVCFDEETLNEYYDKHEATNMIKNHVNSIDYEAIEKFIKPLERKRVVWYDFEGFSLPFPIMEYTLPYQQLVFQVSVIKTKYDEIMNIKNLIIDPKEINYAHIFEIIDSIFDENADAFVVYNKSYENSKLNDMIKILKEHEFIKQDDNFSLLVKKYILKIQIIIGSTVDLWELFKTTSINKNLPPIFLWELYGFSSIKTIEKFITKMGYDLNIMIEPYANLEVKNGLMAMSKAINRRLGAIGDNEWEEVEEQLKKYCENDVKAMLMVYHFVKRLLLNKFEKNKLL
ncbi:MAG: DUF2779 domain-containing protein [Metamycoplasmataceae bacterium]